MQKVLFFLMFTIVAACSTDGQAQVKIDAAQTAKLLKDNPSIQLVDLRTPAELQQTGKIAGARHIDFNNPAFETQLGQLDKSQPVLIYCAAGGRSGSAAIRMAQMGFTKVYDYTGGMSDWKRKGNKTVPQ